MTTLINISLWYPPSKNKKYNNFIIDYPNNLVITRVPKYQPHAITNEITNAPITFNRDKSNMSPPYIDKQLTNIKQR